MEDRKYNYKITLFSTIQTRNWSSLLKVIFSSQLRVWMKEGISIYTHFKFADSHANIVKELKKA